MILTAKIPGEHVEQYEQVGPEIQKIPTSTRNVNLDDCFYFTAISQIVFFGSNCRFIQISRFQNASDALQDSSAKTPACATRKP